MWLACTSGTSRGFGYGVRPDEFFTASIIKVPVMVAVYRKVDEGELSFSQMIEIKRRIGRPGPGGCSGSGRGRQTVGDLLLLMMTQSDNVATNALVRTVGGPTTSTRSPARWGPRTRSSTRS